MWGDWAETASRASILNVVNPSVHVIQTIIDLAVSHCWNVCSGSAGMPNGEDEGIQRIFPPTSSVSYTR